MFKSNDPLVTIREPLSDRKLVSIRLNSIFIWRWNIHRGCLGKAEAGHHYTTKALPLGFYVTYRNY